MIEFQGNLVSSANSDIKWWNEEGKCIKTSEHYLARMFTEYEGYVISGSRHHGTIEWWNKRGNSIKTLTHDCVTSLTVYEGYLITGSEYKNIKWWNKQGNCIKTLLLNSGRPLETSVKKSSSSSSTSTDTSKMVKSTKAPKTPRTPRSKASVSQEEYTSQEVSALTVFQCYLISGSNQSSRKKKDLDEEIKWWDKEGNCVKTLTHMDINALTVCQEELLVSAGICFDEFWLEKIDHRLLGSAFVILLVLVVSVIIKMFIL